MLKSAAMAGVIIGIYQSNCRISKYPEKMNELYSSKLRYIRLVVDAPSQIVNQAP